MENWVNFLIAAAWVAILAVLLWGTATSWRRQLRDSGPLPMFRLLEREGVSVDNAEQAVGMGALLQAAGRCAVCPARRACESGVAGGWLGRRPQDCPNAALFDRVLAAR
jgi:hypothetical protein